MRRPCLASQAQRACVRPPHSPTPHPVLTVPGAASAESKFLGWWQKGSVRACVQNSRTRGRAIGNGVQNSLTKPHITGAGRR
jgi:hypothetical protein